MFDKPLDQIPEVSTLSATDFIPVIDENTPDKFRRASAKIIAAIGNTLFAFGVGLYSTNTLAGASVADNSDDSGVSPLLNADTTFSQVTGGYLGTDGYNNNYPQVSSPPLPQAGLLQVMTIDITADVPIVVPAAGKQHRLRLVPVLYSGSSYAYASQATGPESFVNEHSDAFVHLFARFVAFLPIDDTLVTPNAITILPQIAQYANDASTALVLGAGAINITVVSRVEAYITNP